MSKSEEVKERLGFLKFWLGMIVGTFIALVGWAASNFEKIKTELLLLAGFAAIVLIAAFVFISSKVEKNLKELGKL